MSAPHWRALARALCRRRSVILAYHGIAPVRLEHDPLLLCIVERRLRTQIELLRDGGFAFVTMGELARRLRDGGVGPGLAVLTFDDAMHDNHTRLLPVLREYELPATVYVPTGLLGKPNPWLDPASGERMMTAEELRDLVAAGIELGAHTVDHVDLSELSYERCLEQLTRSRDELERLTGVRATTAAYPFCRYGPEAVRAAADAGFDAAVTCGGRGDWSNPFELPRAAISRKDYSFSFMLKLGDLYDPLFDSAPGRGLRSSTRAGRDWTRARLARIQERSVG